jgi:hypothetical protein
VLHGSGRLVDVFSLQGPGGILCPPCASASGVTGAHQNPVPYPLERRCRCQPRRSGL